jgi:3-hydroxyacyl-[acyl-carrier-protein] dehydratase
MKLTDIIKQLPYSEPFLFVDELLHADENGVTGTYTFKETILLLQALF